MRYEIELRLVAIPTHEADWKTYDKTLKWQTVRTFCHDERKLAFTVFERILAFFRVGKYINIPVEGDGRNFCGPDSDRQAGDEPARS